MTEHLTPYSLKDALNSRCLYSKWRNSKRQIMASFVDEHGLVKP